MLTFGSRGQALLESTFMLPILILLVFGIVYFSNLGMVNVRAQLAVRYGALVLFAPNNTAVYTAADIYSGASQQNNVCGSAVPPVGVFYNASPYPGPTTDPYWVPAADPAPAGTCGLKAINLPGANFLALWLTAANMQVTAKSQMPAYLAGIPGLNPSVTASLPLFKASWPTAIIACTDKMAPTVKGGLTAGGTSPVQVLPASGWPASCPQ
jgi:hypothetical protein